MNGNRYSVGWRRAGAVERFSEIEKVARDELADRMVAGWSAWVESWLSVGRRWESGEMLGDIGCDLGINLANVFGEWRSLNNAGHGPGADEPASLPSFFVITAQCVIS